MGRLILIVLIVLAIYLVWKAFGPSSWKKNGRDAVQDNPRREIKGPDDDEEFLWNIEKQRFKERRATEIEEERQRKQRGEDEPEA